ncbi:MAG: hypothetical protein NUV50_13510, partial [Rhodospirillales bacterium]|nr:hypothetical protein [Rhodospirillales bacterium]
VYLRSRKSARLFLTTECTETTELKLSSVNSVSSVVNISTLCLLFAANSGIFSYSLERGFVKGSGGVSRLSNIVDFVQKTGVLMTKMPLVLYKIKS